MAGWRGGGSPAAERLQLGGPRVDRGALREFARRERVRSVGRDNNARREPGRPIGRAQRDDVLGRVGVVDALLELRQ